VVRVDVKPEMLRRAWERAGYDLDGLVSAEVVYEIPVT